MNNELTKEDYQELLLLIKTSEKIFNSYIELTKLEIINQKETEKYQNELNNLSTLLIMEKEILSTINPNSIFRMIEEVNNQIGCIEKSYNDIVAIIENKMNLLPLERVSKKLKEYVISIFSTASTHNFNEERDELTHLKRTMESSAELMRNLDNDKWLVLITILDIQIDNTLDQELKAKLIRTKYYFSFITPKVEENLLKNNFIAKQEIIFTTDITASLYSISESILNCEKESLGNELFKEQAKKLLTINNEKFNEKQLEIIIRECLIKVSYQFLNENQIKKLQESFKRLIEVIKVKGYEKIAEEIEETFKRYNQDRKLIKKVTLDN